MQLLGKLGEVELALGMEQMLARCEARDEDWYVPELLRIKGELIFAERPKRPCRRRALLLRSLDAARRQGALSWELRSATSLAQLWTE